MTNRLPIITPKDLEETVTEGDREIARYGASPQEDVYRDRAKGYRDVRLVRSKEEEAA